MILSGRKFYYFTIIFYFLLRPFSRVGTNGWVRSYLTGVGSGIADLSCLGEGVVSGESVEDTSESPGCAGLTVTVNLTEISAIA